MSELEAIELGEAYKVFDDDKEFYLKSEADKVIAKKDKEIARLNDKALQYKVLDKEHCRDLNTQERRFALQIAHQKYKRCLDMIEICCEKKENCYNRALRKYTKDEADYLVRKSDFWQGWEFRWLKIAEKFKEAK